MFIVTGGGSGIGQALSIELAKQNKQVLICGRREQCLQETENFYPDNIQYIAGDLTSQSFQTKLVNTACDHKISGLVQCAAQIDPLSPIETMSLEALKAHQKINVEAPLALFQKLRQQLKNARVLHLSSLAAHKAFAGWGAYCMSKASFYMLYEILKIECPDVAFGSVMPGVTDTAMQTSIRNSVKLAESDKAFFKSLYQNDALLSPNVVAQFLSWLLLEVDEVSFSSQEWDIYDNAHQAKWLKSGEVPQL